MLEFFYDPNRYFRERTPLSSIPPAIMVVVASFASAVSAASVIAGAPEQSETYSAIMTVVTLLFNIPIAFVWNLLLLGIYASILHVLASSIFDGGESFGTTVKVAAWGFLPLIFSHLLTSFAYEPELSSKLPFLISTLAIVWQGAIWSFGLRHTHDLSFRNSVLTAGVPVALMLARVLLETA
ncbi:YIP1 family protein [Haladaptatus sp. DFWS20]|uniref:YIP1 family protein n=1 Tax=Haladaptatus sp. DFWS20 TaxID=3403467 RepID=UPI003EBB6C63